MRALLPILLAVAALFVALVSAQDKFIDLPDKSALLSRSRDAWFEATTSAELANEWSTDDESVSFYTRARNSTRFNTVLFVEVRLVGFQQDGYRHFQVFDSDVQRFVDAAGLAMSSFVYTVSAGMGHGAGSAARTFDNDDVNGRDSSSHVADIALEGDMISSDAISAAAAADASADADGLGSPSGPSAASLSVGRGGHRLPVKQKVIFRVRHAPPGVHEAVAERIQASVTAQATAHEAMRAAAVPRARATMATADKLWYRVPHEEVESVLEKDFSSTSVGNAIYVLSPSSPTVSVFPPGASASTPPVQAAARYVYTQEMRLGALQAEDPTLRRRSACESVVWVSRRRFAFIDLTAGPVSYGPSAVGEGIFSELSLPRLDKLFRRHDTEAGMVTDGAEAEAQEVDARVARGGAPPPPPLEGAAGVGAGAGAGAGAVEGDQLRSYRSSSRTREVAAARTVVARGAAAASASGRSNGDAAAGPAFDPMEAVRRDYAAKKTEFLAELAASMRTTTEALISPPVWRFPTPFYPRVVVNLIVVYDHELAVVEELDRWKAVAAALQNVAPPGQVVDVDVSHVQFEQCELCVAAYTHSLRTHTSDVMTSAATPAPVPGTAAPAPGSLQQQQGTIRTKVHSYLDSTAMHDWLEHFEQGFWALRSGSIKDTTRLRAARRGEAPPPPQGKGRRRRGRRAAKQAEADAAAIAAAAAGIKDLTAEDVKAAKFSASSATAVSEAKNAGVGELRVVNAFVFDLNTPESLLFDRRHQAVGAQDAVVAIQTRAAPVAIDAVCNGQPVKLDPADASRPLLAELLTTLYGVAPTGARFSPASNATETEHMWSVGLTPFGHFSAGLDTHFGIRDSAHRNVLLSEVYAAISGLKSVLNTLVRLRKDAREVLSGSEYTTFNQRFNMYHYKLRKAEGLASLDRYGEGLHYAISAQHDARAMQGIMREALLRVKPVLVCAADEAVAAEESAGVIERVLGSLLGTDTTATAPSSVGNADGAAADVAAARARARALAVGHDNEITEQPGSAPKTVIGVKGVEVRDDEEDDSAEAALGDAAAREATQRYTAAFKNYEARARLRDLAIKVEYVLFVLLCVIAVFFLLVRASGHSTGNAHIDEAADLMFQTGGDIAAGRGRWSKCCGSKKRKNT